MVVEEKEYQDNKIIYHLDINEEANGILMHISSLKTKKINRVIKSTTLVSAFYIFSLAFYSYLILSILVYTFFSRMFDLMLPPVAKHSIVVA